MAYGCAAASRAAFLAAVLQEACPLLWVSRACPLQLVLISREDQSQTSRRPASTCSCEHCSGMAAAPQLAWFYLVSYSASFWRSLVGRGEGSSSMVQGSSDFSNGGRGVKTLVDDRSQVRVFCLRARRDARPTERRSESATLSLAAVILAKTSRELLRTAAKNHSAAEPHKSVARRARTAEVSEEPQKSAARVSSARCKAKPRRAQLKTPARTRPPRAERHGQEEEGGRRAQTRPAALRLSEDRRRRRRQASKSSMGDEGRDSVLRSTAKGPVHAGRP